MIRKINLNDNEIAMRVLELQVASYKIEAEIIDFYEIPPLRDTMNSLKECDEIFYGYFIKYVLAGIVSYKIIENVLDIHRVAVHPCFFKKGIAQKLLDFEANKPWVDFFSTQGLLDQIPNHFLRKLNITSLYYYI